MSTIARFSLAEYDRMVECGVFSSRGRRRLEFIRGEIREMAAIGPFHEDVVDRLAEWSARNTSPGEIRIRVQNSIGLPELESAPEPDIAWVVAGDYSSGRPKGQRVLLVIEVAESSLPYDQGEKADLYAEAEVADYWVVNLVDRTIEVHREPAGGHYRQVETFRGDQEVRPLAKPDLALRPSILWK